MGEGDEKDVRGRRRRRGWRIREGRKMKERTGDESADRTRFTLERAGIAWEARSGLSMEKNQGVEYEEQGRSVKTGGMRTEGGCSPGELKAGAMWIRTEAKKRAGNKEEGMRHAKERGDRGASGAPVRPLRLRMGSSTRPSQCPLPSCFSTLPGGGGACSTYLGGASEWAGEPWLNAKAARRISCARSTYKVIVVGKQSKRLASGKQEVIDLWIVDSDVREARSTASLGTAGSAPLALIPVVSILYESQFATNAFYQWLETYVLRKTREILCFKMSSEVRLLSIQSILGHMLLRHRTTRCANLKLLHRRLSGPVSSAMGSELPVAHFASCCTPRLGFLQHIGALLAFAGHSTVSNSFMLFSTADPGNPNSKGFFQLLFPAGIRFTLFNNDALSSYSSDWVGLECCNHSFVTTIHSVHCRGRGKGKECIREEHPGPQLLVYSGLRKRRDVRTYFVLLILEECDLQEQRRRQIHRPMNVSAACVRKTKYISVPGSKTGASLLPPVPRVPDLLNGIENLAARICRGYIWIIFWLPRATKKRKNQEVTSDFLQISGHALGSS
ncbi:hypothetical protein FB451DRAFT_1191320 [Mycena latifolia]|nr:hypothetical protein FB451DRAFT_1191320 [Mycena latifolia]